MTKKQQTSLSLNEDISDESEIRCSQTLRAAMYIHLNTSDLNKNLSIKTQIMACKDFIERQGWSFGDFFLEKEDNAEDFNHPILRLMQAREKSGCFDVIVSSAAFSQSMSDSKINSVIACYNVFRKTEIMKVKKHGKC